jgi:hypothetical protein
MFTLMAPMAADPLDALRLTLMQDVLPVGLAVVERARKGGPREVFAAFEGNPSDSIDRLKQEGEPVARELRDSLDRVQPGLGNPVMKVEVRDVPFQSESPAAGAAVAEWAVPGQAEGGVDDALELQANLARITARLNELERRLA